jgi:hypothetical protein
MSIVLCVIATITWPNGASWSVYRIAYQETSLGSIMAFAYGQ